MTLGFTGPNRSEIERAWNRSDDFVDLRTRPQFVDSSALCTRLAIRKDSGVWARRFHQGERAHFFFEFQALQEIWRPAGGVELLDQRGLVVHGKNMFQYGLSVPDQFERGAVFQCHIWFELRLCPGTYTVTLGLAGADEAAYEGYLHGEMGYEEFAPRQREHCRVVAVATIDVGYQADAKLSHHGIADLPGAAHFQVSVAPPQSPLPPVHTPEGPTVFHVTHWKAGSQWIYKILAQCFPDRIVEPQLEEAQVRRYQILKGHIYPTVYLSKREMDRIALPPGSKRFVVIRDLRDTLISAYFSFKISHPILDRSLQFTRDTLVSLSEEEGFLYLIETFLPACAEVQASWLNSGELVLKYEDLLRDDAQLLEHALIEHCGLPIARQRLQEVVMANRFEALTNGRARGLEDVSAHERKGVAGDWRNYLTPRLKAAIKLRFGGLLVAAGYECDLDW